MPIIKRQTYTTSKAIWTAIHNTRRCAECKDWRLSSPGIRQRDHARTLDRNGGFIRSGEPDIRKLFPECRVIPDRQSNPNQIWGFDFDYGRRGRRDIVLVPYIRDHEREDISPDSAQG